MTSSENAVRTLLHESDIPPSRLDASQLLAGGKRSRRRRRVASTAGVMVAVVALVVPAVVVASKVTRKVPPIEFATTTKVVHRKTATAGKPLRCAATPYTSPVDGDRGGVFAADVSGERVVGVSSDAFLTLWTSGKPERFTLPNRRPAIAVAVNRGGAVLGHDTGDPVVNFVYGDGRLTYLKTPDGYRRAQATSMNEHGDALGTADLPTDSGPSGRLVVWPADQRDQPRLLPDADLLRPLAIHDDGTVIAVRIVAAPEAGGNAVVILRPDGTRLQIDAPAGFDLLGGALAAAVNGDLLYTVYTSGEQATVDNTRPDVSIPLMRAVRWNLRTGLVEIFDDLEGMVVGNTKGWFVSRTMSSAGGRPVLVAPDRKVRELPFVRQVVWVGPGGSDLISGDVSDNARWHCNRST
jgi:hypothetical protein